MQFELTKEQFVEMKETGMSDLEIAKLFGISKGAVQYRKQKWGLVEKRSEGHVSLCWHCRRARPSMCEWISARQIIFDNFTIRKLKIGSPRSNRYEDVIIVTKCKQFEPIRARRRKRDENQKTNTPGNKQSRSLVLKLCVSLKKLV